ncbi:MAG: MFS transporter [Thaumarchaeota archaeon]|nr:MFS transporter [Nitrososphaerota archaeon]
MDGFGKRTQLENFGIVWTSQTTAAILIFAVPALGPLLVTRVALTPTEIGELVGITYLGIVSVSVFFGAIADYLGVRKILFLGHVLEAVSILGASFAHDFTGLAISVLGVGFGYSSITPVTSKAIINWFSKNQRSSVMGLKQTGTTVGASIAGALLPVIGVRYGLPASFIVAGILVLIGSSFLLWYKESESNPNSKKGFAFLREGLSLSLKNSNLRWVGGVGFFYASVQAAVSTYIALFAQDKWGYNVVEAGLFLSLVNMAGTLGRPVFGLVSDRLLHGNRILDLLVISLTSSVTLVLLSFTGPNANIWVLVAVVALLGFGALGWNGVFLALSGEYSDTGYEAVGTSLAFSLAMTGQVVGAPLFGLIVEKTGTYSSAWQTYAVLLISASLVFTMAKYRSAVGDSKSQDFKNSI